MTAGFDARSSGSGPCDDWLSNEFTIVCLAFELKQAFNDIDVDCSSEEEDMALARAVGGLSEMLRKQLRMKSQNAADYINGFFSDCTQHRIECRPDGIGWAVEISEYK